MDTAALAQAIARVADLAEQLAAARRDVIREIVAATKTLQQVEGRFEQPAVGQLERFDRDVAAVLVAGGFVQPLRRFGHLSPTGDASNPRWEPRRDADTAVTMTTRWHGHLAKLSADLALKD